MLLVCSYLAPYQLIYLVKQPTLWLFIHEAKENLLLALTNVMNFSLVDALPGMHVEP